MIILLDPYKQTNFKMRKCLRSVGYDEKRILDFADPKSVIEKIHLALNSDVAVEMIIADIYFKGDITSLKIIREFDSVPAVWKTPFILYTNETDKNVIEQYMRYARHIPLIYILKSNDEGVITRTISNLSKHIEKNMVYIDAEMKVIDAIEMKDFRRISNIAAEFSKIKWEKKDIQMYRLDTLLGELYFEFWKEGNKKLKEIQQKLLKVMRGTTAYETVRREFTDEEGKSNFLLENAEKNLDNAIKENPDFWKTNYIFYEIAMEKGDYKNAKEYLLRLIKLFPEEFNYSYQLGRIFAMENQYNIAMQHFEDASKKAVTEGISGITEEDILDITDESMKMAQKILKKSNASDFTDLKKIKEDSEDRYLLDIIKKNNAQIRTALYQLSKKSTGDKTVQADYQNKIAVTFRRSGDYVMANNAYQEAIKLDPENPIIRLNSAACLALLNLFDQAKAEASKAMEYNKGDIDGQIISRIIALIDEKNIEGIKRILV
ncbi:MAG: tetratricopeptide repeat protein [Nitrospinae bacterium]|nr:tetratricopeptide repeat protein [Nitrospinota bacterium]